MCVKHSRVKNTKSNLIRFTWNVYHCSKYISIENQQNRSNRKIVINQNVRQPLKKSMYLTKKFKYCNKNMQ